MKRLLTKYVYQQPGPFVKMVVIYYAYTPGSLSLTIYHSYIFSKNSYVRDVKLNFLQVVYSKKIGIKELYLTHMCSSIQVQVNVFI